MLRLDLPDMKLAIELLEHGACGLSNIFVRVVEFNLPKSFGLSSLAVSLGSSRGISIPVPDHSIWCERSLPWLPW